MGVVGLGLLSFCGMYYFLALFPAQHEAQSLRRELEAIRASASISQKSQRPEDQLRTFYAAFPGIEKAPDALARLNEVALATGVTLDQGEYTLMRKDGERLVRHGVTLPIKGDYIKVRKFLSAVLVDIPYASLDGVEFQRQKISDMTLDVQVKMTLFFVDHQQND